MLTKNPASTETINAVFGALPPNNPSFSLTKHYKGITLSENVRVVDIRPECTTIQATQREIFPCLTGDIYLHSKTFPQSIAAQIHPVDYAQGIFLLSEFNYSEWRDRSSERVQPKDSVYLKLFHNRETYRAFLVDISTSGMGIMGNKTMDPFNQLKPGEKVEMEFQLNEKYHYSDLIGELVYRHKVGLHLVKFGLELLPTSFQKRSLRRYITHRVDEILEEVNQNYLRSCDPHRVENLYF
jgi:hypothetical protein